MFKKELSKVISAKFELDSKEVESLLEIPPNPELGDFAFPCFILAKKLKKSPSVIASQNTDIASDLFERVKAVGPYLNFYLKNNVVLEQLESEIKLKQVSAKEVIMLESPSPNTNKPLHLGHLRNILIAQSLQKLYEKLGHKVILTEIVNDRGTHICKSMLAYKLFGNDETPESAGMKGDKFVGKYYVKFANEVKKDSSLDEKAQNMLVKWENKDPEVVRLWSKMREWCLKGMLETYNELGLHIDSTYYESEIYLHGKEIVSQGRERGIFKEDETGAIFVDLESKGLGQKYLQRADGTSIYITQDIYLGKKRFEDTNMDRMLYVVASEQKHHFKVLFEIFKLLNYSFASKCHHVSYGMVNLPDGKMKSREGTVVEIDELLEKTKDDAKRQILERYPDLDSANLSKRTDILAHSALRFFILKFDAEKDMVYDPKESLSFSGESGPYVQYVYARLSKLFEKADVIPVKNSLLLNEDLEKLIGLKLIDFNEVVLKATNHKKPNYVCNYLLELSKLITKYYHEVKIISSNKDLMAARLHLLSLAQSVIKEGLDILGITVIEEM